MVRQPLLTGNASIKVENTTGYPLNLYCPGTISLGGNGMLNSTADPSKATI